MKNFFRRLANTFICDAVGLVGVVEYLARCRKGNEEPGLPITEFLEEKFNIRERENEVFG